MYAVVITGGKQYRVTAGSTLQVEKLNGAAGDTVKLDQVLALSGESRAVIGTPNVPGASVEAQIVEQGKGDKVLIFKKKRRHNYRRLNGHRQHLTTLYITKVILNGAAVASAEPKAVTPKKEAAAPKKAAAKPAAKTEKPAAKEKAAAPKKPAAKKPATKKA